MNKDELITKQQLQIEELKDANVRLYKLNVAYGSAFEKQDVERQKQLHTINQLRQKLKSKKLHTQDK